MMRLSFAHTRFHSDQILIRLSVSLLIVLLAVFSIPSRAGTEGSPTCAGQFPNTLTDICWSCILPMSIGSTWIGDIGAQEDIENPSNPVC